MKNPSNSGSGSQPPAAHSGATRADEIKNNPPCSILSDAKNEHQPRRVFIGITGPMQSGKDTLADSISYSLPTDWMRPHYHFADPLKHALRALIGGGHENYWGTDQDKNKKTRFEEELGPAFATYRTAMQHTGTELFRRHVHPDFWIFMAKDRVNGYLDAYHSSPVAFIFPDVRFDNEAKFIRDRGGIIVRVWRTDGKVGTTGIAGHQSEAGISEKLITHRFAIGPNGHRDVARIILNQVGIKP
jgi:hypothetical protein